MDGLVVSGEQLIIPLALQEEVIQLVHEGRQGQDKALQWMRQSVWFPNMEAKVRELVCGVLFTMPGSTGQDRDKAPEADRGSRGLMAGVAC